MLILATILSAYELLWAMVKERHPVVATKYELVAEGGHRIGAPSAEHVAEHFIQAEFNADRQPDYAIVVVPRAAVGGYAVLALLEQGRDEMVVTVIDHADGRAEGVTLAAHSRKKAGAVLVVTPQNGKARRFAWDVASETFRELPPG